MDSRRLRKSAHARSWTWQSSWPLHLPPLVALASFQRAQAREREAPVRQLVFEFVREHALRSGVKLDPKVEGELVERLAEAILAVIQSEQGESHEESDRS